MTTRARQTQEADAAKPDATAPASAGAPAATGGAEPRPTYDGRQITENNRPGMVQGGGGQAPAPASEVDKANPRESTDDAPPAARPNTPERAVPSAGRAPVNAGAAAVATPPAGAPGPLPNVQVFREETAEERARRQNAGREGLPLLLEACETFGINPDADLPPFDPRKNKPDDARHRAFRQLLSWNYYPAEQSADGYASVVLVTAGGVKLRYSDDPANRFDEDTINRLRQAFQAFKRDPKTGDVVAQPLPRDLALPLPALLGFPIKADQVFRGGYLNAGGREEADRRAAAGR